MGQCGFYKPDKKRVWINDRALQFRMILYSDKPRVVFQLDNFYKTGFGINAHCLQPCCFNLVKVLIVKFIPVTMPLLPPCCTGCCLRTAARFWPAPDAWSAPSSRPAWKQPRWSPSTARPPPYDPCRNSNIAATLRTPAPAGRRASFQTPASPQHPPKKQAWRIDRTERQRLPWTGP